MTTAAGPRTDLLCRTPSGRLVTDPRYLADLARDLSRAAIEADAKRREAEAVLRDLAQAGAASAPGWAEVEAQLLRAIRGLEETAHELEALARQTRRHGERAAANERRFEPPLVPLPTPCRPAPWMADRPPPPGLVAYVEGVEGSVGEAVEAIAHPVRTLKGVAFAIRHPIRTGRAALAGLGAHAWDVARGDPHALGEATGGLLAGGLLSRLLPTLPHRPPRGSPRLAEAPRAVPAREAARARLRSAGLAGDEVAALDRLGGRRALEAVAGLVEAKVPAAAAVDVARTAHRIDVLAGRELGVRAGALDAVHALVASGNLNNPGGLRRFLEDAKVEVDRGQLGRVRQLQEAARRSAHAPVALEKLVEGGRVVGRGDVIDLSRRETLQMKVVTSKDPKAVLDRAVEASFQFNGEVPPPGHARVVLVVVEEGRNPLAHADRGSLLSGAESEDGGEEQPPPR